MRLSYRPRGEARFPRFQQRTRIALWLDPNVTSLPIGAGALSSSFLIASGATGPIMMCIEPVDTRFVGSVMGITRLGARWTSD